MMRLDESVEERAKRYIVLQDVYGHDHNVAREYCHLPERLAKAIDEVMLAKVDGSNNHFQLRPELKKEVKKVRKFLDICIWSYREYYRERSERK